MTIDQAFVGIRREKRSPEKWAYWCRYMAGYMRQYRRTPKGRSVVRKANRRYYRKNQLALSLYYHLTKIV